MNLVPKKKFLVILEKYLLVWKFYKSLERSSVELLDIDFSVKRMMLVHNFQKVRIVFMYVNGLSNNSLTIILTSAN